MATFATAEDEFVDADGVRFAYRQLGGGAATPLVMLMHFRGSMDHWDPALVDALAATRPVVLLDNAGVGRSSGAVPVTMAGWAAAAAAAVRAIGLTRVDVLGFSMGASAAQMLALDGPATAGLEVRRLVLAGTSTSVGPGILPPPDMPLFQRLMEASGPEENRAAFLEAFFHSSPRSRAAGEAAWHRIANGRPSTFSRCDYLGLEGAQRQAVAFGRFLGPDGAAEGAFPRLAELRIPVLVANGSHDRLLPTENSYVIWKNLVNADAHLHLYPDSAHGFLYQYAEHFATLVNAFLDAPDPSTAASV